MNAPAAAAAAATWPAAAPLSSVASASCCLRAVDVGPGGAVDHGVGRGGGDRGAHGGLVADVEVVAGEARDVVAGALGGGAEVAPEHARGAGQEQAHRR